MYAVAVDKLRVADVAIDPRSGGQDAIYTYRLDEPANVGQAVFVPLGPRTELGFVTRIYEATEEDLGFPHKRLRAPTGIVQGLSLPEAIVELARFTADEYLCSLPTALAAATPPGVRDRLVNAWTLTDATPDPSTLTPLQAEALRTLRDSGGTLVESATKKPPAGVVRALQHLKSKGLVDSQMTIAPPKERRVKEAMLKLCADESKVDAFLAKEGKKKPAQALTLMRLQTTERASLTASEIKALAGVTDTTVKALVAARLLEAVEGEAETLTLAPRLNPYQQLAVDSIVESVQAREASPFLLFGVTGSGKTEVYLRAASEALRMGRKVLYLVPEIALATQAIAQLRSRFGRSVAILHSELPPAERLQSYLNIRQGEVSVVLGARSALFAPLTDIGLIVLDEEHESTYKQDSSPRYHAKRLAMFLSRRHQCPIVLGSATPSVESFYEAEEEKLTLLSLPERAASASLPTVHVQDLTEGYKTGHPSILTEQLYERIESVLGKGEQVILFLNRRAYSPFLICRDCGHRVTCPHCAVALSFHRRDGRLRCHHCGFQTRPPDTCPSCLGSRISPFGVGTEKVEEAVAASFPDARVARLDRDVAKKKGALQETLAAFRGGDTQVLVGTQMVAKGLDFPKVTLVGVIAADMSLNIPDFRSSERTYQLLSQVAGRAGRGLHHGNVVIQTFNPTHPAIVGATAHDFSRFYESLKLERESAMYPPFRRLVNVVFSGESRAEVVRVGADAAARLAACGQVLGPVDCPLEKIQNRFRRHILVKLPPEAPAAPVAAALKDLEVGKVSVVVDVDPYSLM